VNVVGQQGKGDCSTVTYNQDEIRIRDNMKNFKENVCSHANCKGAVYLVQKRTDILKTNLPKRHDNVTKSSSTVSCHL
jgi:hypothetical protein